MSGAVGLTIVRPEAERAAIARTILEALPEWFGLPESLEDYIARASDLPMIAADSGGIVGFLSLEQKTLRSSEIYVIGVCREWHRRGVGHALVEAAASDLRGQGLRYLIVKTVSARRSNSAYEATRRFYEGVGFDPLDELPKLWGPDNPCLLMLKCL